MTRNAERLPLNFRFKTGSDQLDNKAYRDLGRLVQLMSTGDSDRDVLLLGFADGTGTASTNDRLSKDRAAAVERELFAEGIKPAVVDGFGSALPVASNDTDDGRQRNRRVEIWLRFRGSR